MVGAIQSVEVGMGEPVLILAFVVIVIGGIGSIKGAMVGSVLVGLTDTLGGVFLAKSVAAVHGYFHSHKRRVLNRVNGYIHLDGGSSDLEAYRPLWVALMISERYINLLTLSLFVLFLHGPI